MKSDMLLQDGSLLNQVLGKRLKFTKFVFYLNYKTRKALAMILV